MSNITIVAFKLCTYSTMQNSHKLVIFGIKFVSKVCTP